jgi:hypothetical protein
MNVSDIMHSAQFIVGKSGKPTAVVLNMDMWETILSVMENIEDREVVRERMRNWQTKEGWTSWEDFEAENNEISVMD